MTMFGLLSCMIVSSFLALSEENAITDQVNVNGGPLKVCSKDPMTGWYRDGKCHTDAHDSGTHTVCATMTKEFLEYTKSKGNDLSSPVGDWFPGLKPGNHWCLCALRWNEARKAGKAPKVFIEATNNATLKYVKMEMLKKHDDRNL